jgi:hypothetical protein
MKANVVVGESTITAECKAKPKDIVPQIFREYGKCIFVGKCAKPKQVGDNQAESSGLTPLNGLLCRILQIPTLGTARPLQPSNSLTISC